MTGAQVVVGEPPGGSKLRRSRMVDTDAGPIGVAWEYLRANTASVVVDAGASLADLAEGFDAVVLDCQGDLAPVQADIAAARGAHPELVTAAITPYGFSGPKSAWRAGPLEHWALGGHMSLNGEPDRHPLPGGGPWLTHLVGATAAIGIQAALVNAATTGGGDLVEISALEALANAHQWSFSLYTHNGVTKRRWGNRFGEQHHPLALYECIDGWVCIAAVSIHQWEGFCIAIDQVELLARDDFYVPAVRFDHADELDEIISAWAATKTVAEAVTDLQDNHVPSGAVASLDDMLASPQLAARDYWVNLDAPSGDAAPGDSASAASESDGSPLRDVKTATPAGFRLPGPPARIAGATPQFRRAPALGTGAPAAAAAGREPLWPERVKPLAGLRVVEFTIAWAGPLVCRMLGDLVATADIVVNNYSPRGVRSTGITAAELREMNPAIVTLDMSGFGATGPDAERISWGPVLDAASGLASTTGYPDSGPYKQGIAFPDVVGGLHGTVIALAALWQHWCTGEPVAVDLSQLETAIAVAGGQFAESSMRRPGTPPPARRGNSARLGPVPYRMQGDALMTPAKRFGAVQISRCWIPGAEGRRRLHSGRKRAKPS